MKYQKGSVALVAVLVVLVVIVGVGGGYYVAMNPSLLQRDANNVENTEEQATPEDRNVNNGTAGVSQKSSIEWRFAGAGEEDNIPYTNVTVVINNIPYEVGKFQGSCSEIGASGGVDGTGLLAGELSGAQCWFAGGGDEVGVFAHEDGGFDIMVGGLSEGIEGGAFFRGDFEIRQSVQY
jgi:hypothetical protein